MTRHATSSLTLIAAALLLLPASTPRAAGDSGGTALQSAASADADLQKSLKDLAALRARIAEEKIPLTRELASLEARVSELRVELQDAGRALDTRNLEMGNLAAQTKGRRDEATYLSNLLDEYVRNFETRVHITELERYRPLLDRAHAAADSDDRAAAYGPRLEVVNVSLDRLLDLLGGESFPGRIVADNGKVKDVTYTLIGPVAVYNAEDGSSAGLAQQRLGSLEPNAVSFEEPEYVADVRNVVSSGSGTLPFDPSLGNARKIEETHEFVFSPRHIEKGGVVMIPIIALAFAAMLVGILKWLQIARIRRPSRRKLNALFEALKARNHAAAAREAEAMPGPIGEMFRAGMEHIDEPKELIEEVMFEKMLETRLRLQGFLPFVAMSASAAPLLGLLGTVTGMISTFKLITIFGSGDARTLSSGISEALITTEFGLIVAIPSLLLYAYLSRKARRLTDDMEKNAVSFLNRIPTPPAVGPRPVEAATAS